MARRRIAASEVVNDIRSGMEDVALMEKYKLTAKGLQHVLRQLVNKRAMRRKELYRQSETYADKALVEDLRSLPRHLTAIPVSIYGADDLELEGRVMNVTEKGVQVTGIPAAVDESKRFLIRVDRFQEIEPFVFEGLCRWARVEKHAREPVAGIEITDISQAAMQELRKVIGGLTLSD
ncbi:MAG: PilZ domain-containing protein [Deltaproteobacteria bacterium]